MTVVKKSWLLNQAPQSFRDRHKKCYPWCDEETCQLPAFFVGFSTTSRSRCQEQSCLKKIAKDVLIITYKRHNFILQTQSAPLLEQGYHAACFFQCQSRGLIPRPCEKSNQLKNFSTLSTGHKKYINRMVKDREALWEVNSKLELNQIVKGRKMHVVKKARVVPFLKSAQGKEMPVVKKARVVPFLKSAQGKKMLVVKKARVVPFLKSAQAGWKHTIKVSKMQTQKAVEVKKEEKCVLLRPPSFGSFAVYRPKKRKSTATNANDAKKKIARKKLKKKTFTQFNAWLFPDDDWQPE